jgi:hypothetical protein
MDKFLIYFILCIAPIQLYSAQYVVKREYNRMNVSTEVAISNNPALLSRAARPKY